MVFARTDSAISGACKMTGFTKLFSSIITSSIWSEDDKTRIMWITMLASADARGHVSGSIPGMAAIARMSVEEAKNSIRSLCQPDPYSRSSENDGRRLIEIEGGWLITNYAKYRLGRNPEKRREQNRKAQEKFRRKPKVSQNKQEVSKRKQKNADVIMRNQSKKFNVSETFVEKEVTTKNRKPKVSQCKPMSAKAEAEDNNPPIVPPKGETSVFDNNQQPQAKCSKTTIGSDNGKLFEQFWAIYPRKVGKKKCLQIWDRLNPSENLTERILAGVRRYSQTTQWQTEDGRFIPHPATFLNQQRWEDKIEIDQLDSYRRFGTHPASKEEIGELKRKGIL
jgi:hypothetical protein